MAADPGVADLLRALLPRPAVMLVRALHRSPAETFGNTNVYAVLVSREGIDRLSRYLWEYLDKDGQGQLHRAVDGPDPESPSYVAPRPGTISNTAISRGAEAR